MTPESGHPLEVQGFPIEFTTPHLECGVILNAERASHIAERHPDLWYARSERLEQVLKEPDWIQTDAKDERGNKRIFVRKYTHLYTVVAVILETEYAWIIHASRISRRLKGNILWQREA
jgi:hypothetical protein